MSSTNCFISSSCNENHDIDDDKDNDGDLGGVNGRIAGHEVDTVVNVPQQMLSAVISRQETCHKCHLIMAPSTSLTQSRTPRPATPRCSRQLGPGSPQRPAPGRSGPGDPAQ